VGGLLRISQWSNIWLIIARHAFDNDSRNSALRAFHIVNLAEICLLRISESNVTWLIIARHASYHMLMSHVTFHSKILKRKISARFTMSLVRILVSYDSYDVIWLWYDCENHMMSYDVIWLWVIWCHMIVIWCHMIVRILVSYDSHNSVLHVFHWVQRLSCIWLSRISSPFVR